MAQPAVPRTDCSDSDLPQAPPSLGRFLLEARALPEMAGFALSALGWGRLPRGDGHPVLVIPGFATDDAATAPLRFFLGRLGHDVHGWGLGRNVGDPVPLVDSLCERVGDLGAGSRRRVSLIGVSLGGVYARAVASVRPDDLRMVITLASPFRNPDPELSNARRFLGIVGLESAGGATPEWATANLSSDLAVPSTAIYSRGDGVVPWQNCVDSAGELCENIEVRGSHGGIAHNPASLLAVADRLAQPEGAWERFESPARLGLLYPPGDRS